MIDFKIKQETCIQCGLCAKDCPVSIIELAPFPKIIEEKENNCIRCQHCLAVCPTGALSIWGIDPKDSFSINGKLPKPEEMTRLIKTRRSIRKYKDENVDKDLINEMLETSLYAPTGENKNAVLFSIIDNKTELAKFRDLLYESIKKHEKEGTIPARYQAFSKLQQIWENKGIDIIFRGAPHMLIASASNKASSAIEDSIIALSYFELLANSNDIGTVWNGMVKLAINMIAPELKDVLGIPKDHIFGYAIVFGKSDIKYSRAIQLKGNHINKISF